MASHLHLSRLQSTSQINRFCPCHLQIPTTPLSLLPPSTRTTTKNKLNKLHAQGRGFGLTTTTSDNKQRPKGGSSNNNNNNEGGEGEGDAIPEAVINRMLVRILASVGAPMALGIGLLYVLSSLRERGVWESPAWVPLLAVLVTFGTSAFGIAYGTLSSSWDTEKEGSLLGWEQAQKNWPEIWKEEEEEGKR